VVAISHCKLVVSVAFFILLQALLFVPLVLVRNLTRLSGLALLAGVCIVAGLIYIFWNEAAVIVQKWSLGSQAVQSDGLPAVHLVRMNGSLLPRRQLANCHYR
jgi:hypothetical protein